MTAPDGHLSPLDPRFPIAMTHGIQIFGGLLSGWEDRATLIEQTRRATEEAMRREERYVVPAPEPRFVPALAHEDTIVDFRLTDGDRFRPEDTLVVAVDRETATDQFLIRYEQADARERAQRERSAVQRVRRTIGRWARWARGT